MSNRVRLLPARGRSPEHDVALGAFDVHLHDEAVAAGELARLREHVRHRDHRHPLDAELGIEHAPTG